MLNHTTLEDLLYFTYVFLRLYQHLDVCTCVKVFVEARGLNAFEAEDLENWKMQRKGTGNRTFVSAEAINVIAEPYP